jgi:mRNA interferase MazF
MTDPAPRRGEVWLARVDKVRPVVVMTRDPLGLLLNAVIVVPVTSTIRGLSTEVPLGLPDGVRRDSVASADNLQLLARNRLVRRVGRARSATMRAMCGAVSIAVGCDAVSGSTPE